MSYTVKATHWTGGWELEIEGVGVTQSKTLERADAMIRDYLRLDGFKDWEAATVNVAVSLDGLEDHVETVRQEIREAEQAQIRAAKRSRELAQALRDKGLSVTDAAQVMGVSKGRVSQLCSKC